MPNLEIDLLGKPKAKARPRWDSRSRRIYTPSTKYEIECSKELLQYKGKYAGETELAVCCFFFGASPKTAGIVLWKFICDALVRAGVIDNECFVVFGSFEKKEVDGEGNPFSGQPSTRIIMGHWD